MAVAVENVKTVNRIIDDKLKELMTTFAQPADVQYATAGQRSTNDYSDELAERVPPRALPQPTLESRVSARAEDELMRWGEDRSQRQRVGDRRETVLEFWGRMQREGEYKILPKVARAVFAIPVSSAAIEHDFSASGRMVTSLAPSTIDMCTFLNRNQCLVDSSQCPEIPRAECR